MRPRTLLILTAVMMEAKAIAAALEMACPDPKCVSQKTFDDLTVSLAVTGVSARELGNDAADFVIMAGLAGALSRDLRVGDLVIDDWFGEVDVPTDARRGTIHSSHRIAATPAEKAALHEQTQSLAVEMENAAVRRWAAARGARFGAIRAISDRADQSLDPAVLKLVDEWGRPKPLSLVRTLVLRPRLIPHLLRLGADSKKAASRLGAAVRETVEQMVRQMPAKNGSH